MKTSGYYTYLHYRLDTEQVFYVGKGRGNRAHVRCRGHRSSWWRAVASKHGFRVEIAARWVSEEEAFQHERLLIAVFRELGHPLVNLTDGGEGASGSKRSADVLARQSASLRKTYASEELRARMSDRASAFFSDPENLARFTERMREPELREKFSRAQKERQSDPEERRKIGERSRAMWQDQSYREKVMAAKNAANQRHEYRYLMAHAVECMESGEVFPSMREAARRTGIHFSEIQAICSGRQKTARGMSFRRIKEKA